MKKLLFLLCIMLSLHCLSNNVLSRHIISNKPICGFVENDSYIEFEMDIDKPCDCILRFWVLGHRDSNGNYIKYPVYLNDEYVGSLNTKIANWHFAVKSSDSVFHFKEGINKIRIDGRIPDIPNIEFVEAIHDSVSFGNSVSEYSNYLIHIKDVLASKCNQQRIVGDYDDIINDEDSILYDYSYSIGQSFDYTFLMDLYFKSGDKVFIEGYPIDNTPYVLELFHEKNPETNGWISMSDKEGLACIDETIKEAGRYYFRARTKINGKYGFCSVNINGAIFDSIPIYSCNIPCDIDVDEKCNIFTCNSGNSDPVVLALGEDYKILAFDDDYGGDYAVEGSINWGHDARVRKEFKEKPKYVSVSSFSSYVPVGVTDVYMGCKEADSYLNIYFKNLNINDCMESAPATLRYNCLAWALGVWDEWIWPSSEILKNKTIEEQILYFCDEFNDYGYEQCDENSATIDLWAKLDTSGNILEVTHASVRNIGTNRNFLHGYAWESKLGANERIFHQRYALEGVDYGKIVLHFKPDVNTKHKSLYERIADGEIVKDDGCFTSDEIDFITNKVNLMDKKIYEQFMLKYSLWRNIAETLPYSNMQAFTNNPQYKDFCKFCIENPQTKYLIFFLVEKEEVLSMQIMEDLIKPKYAFVFNKMQEKFLLSDAKRSVPVYRGNFAKTKYFVKELIRLDMGIRKVQTTSLCEQSCIDDFNVRINGHSMTVEIELSIQSKTELLVYSLDGILITTFVDNLEMEAGHYSYSSFMEMKGTYLVVLKSGGETKVKKILII